MFSERRELALSVVSCLLPSSYPSLLLAPAAPRSLEQLGNLQQNTAVMRLPLDPSCDPGWPCPALKCPVSAWGTSLYWKERCLGLPIQECRRGGCLLPTSSPPLAAATILWGPCLEAFLARALGTPPPMRGHLSGEG